MLQPKHDAGAKETVLLRQAAPKYNFSGRKLPIESTKITSSGKADLIGSSSDSSAAQFPVKSDSMKTRPIAVVGASVQLPPTTTVGNVKAGTSPLELTQTLPAISTVTQSASAQSLSISRSHSNRSDSQNIAAEGISANPPVSLSYSAPSQQNVSASQYNRPSVNVSASQYNRPSVNACATLAERSQPAAVPLTVVQRGAPYLVSEQSTRDAHFKHLENERDQLKKELEVQLQVNSELKRLLVASVGDDLSQRVERLCRDRAQLSLDLGGFSKKMSEEYENLDKVSIQADMWRSKYLASRVMIEELGNARAFYTLQCHDSQDALQQMLNERHELRTNLLEVHRILQQMKSAFDPLNAQRSSTLQSTNVLDLSRSCQQLAEAMRFRLLPAHVAVKIDTETDETLWTDSVTRAEQFAHEVLSRPIEPPGCLQSGSAKLLPLKATADLQVCRFHPNTRHDNLTYNCCAKCKGEINVI